MSGRGEAPLGQHESRRSDKGSVAVLRQRFSRGFYIGLGGVGLMALFLAAVGFAASRSPKADQPLPIEEPGTPIPVEVTVVPPKVTPDPDITREMPPTPVPPQPKEEATPVPSPQRAAATEAPEVVASSWSMAPLPVEAKPAPAPEPSAVGLAQEAQERFGIRIVLEGQDWGANEASQVVNIRAVISAMERMPRRVISAVVGHPHGPLTFVSNREGRTLQGWQPYGGFPIGYYTNSDQGPQGAGPANQVVLVTGSTDMSIGHEILHAYQFRNVGPDQYVLAMLGEEMRSFAQATGWRQLGSDEDIRQAADDPWEVFNSLFVYEGRPLTYATTGGATTTISPANPLEAFAIAGSIYYTRPAWMPLPDWPEYWAWFASHLG